jgi:carbon storage regulator
MLVMSRRQGDTILIGDEIEIVISHIGRSKVKVGIRAPRTIPVIAREVKMVRDQNLAAAAALLSAPALSGLLRRLNPASDSATPENAGRQWLQDEVRPK